MSCSEAEESSLLKRSFRFFIFSSKAERERTSELCEGVGVLTSGMPPRPAFRARMKEGTASGIRAGGNYGVNEKGMEGEQELGS